jgi:hypothetical protein
MVWLLLAVFSTTAGAKTIYVDDDANGLNNGSSWDNAYNFLQDALADAKSAQKPVEIRVAQGTYRLDEDTLHPNGTGIREATFQLINSVTLKGGYAGYGQPDPNNWNIDLYKTILSGDLDGNDVEVSDPCDLLTEPTRAENSYHVVTGSKTDATAILDGFTVTGGKANGFSFFNDSGGGMCSFLGRPTVSNCTFTANSAYWGGGMHNEVSSPTLTNCAFIGNAALTTPRGQAGGGLSNWSGSSPVLNRCIFVRNFAYSSGGGICNDNGCNAILKNCVFAGNRAKRIGGGMSIDESDITLVNCTFAGNVSSGGNGLAFDSPGHKFPSSARITNCILWDGGSEIQNYDNSTIAITYSDVQGGWSGESNLNKDPCFADSNNADYHLKSQAGRWAANSASWVKDDVTSPCIDAGDPASPVGLEPFPNGGRINMGAYGGTAEASKSYFGEPVCETIVAGDINGDCKVDFKDFAIMAFHWLKEH